MEGETRRGGGGRQKGRRKWGVTWEYRVGQKKTRGTRKRNNWTEKGRKREKDNADSRGVEKEAERMRENLLVNHKSARLID